MARFPCLLSLLPGAGGSGRSAPVALQQSAESLVRDDVSIARFRSTRFRLFRVHCCPPSSFRCSGATRIRLLLGEVHEVTIK